MPALAKCSPSELKGILIEAGWRVYTKDQYNWSLVRGIGTESIEIPRKGKTVSFTVLYQALEKAELGPGDYFEHLATVRDRQPKARKATD
jgi:hypothetical protein